MRIVVQAGVTAAVSPGGELTLISPGGVRYFYTPEATAMWIALRQHDGDLDAVTYTLGQAWAVSVDRLRDLIEERVSDWQELGLVSGLPPHTHTP
ncbi:hypothetical protein ACFY8K_35695 [Streptomyces misionensis]|uniref:hypothetical protein n=1 Tax=Streptomyces misionensis TaxID=67331 RepID=UPI0036A46504